MHALVIHGTSYNSTCNKYIVKRMQGIVIIQGMTNITWCPECKLEVKRLQVTKVENKSDKEKMAEQVITSEAIMKAVADATRIMIQMMVEMQAQRSDSQ